MSYVIGTGFYAAPDDDIRTDERNVFFWTWLANTEKYAAPRAIYVIAAGIPDKYQRPGIVKWITGADNLGHVGDLLHHNYKNKLCGWSMSVIIGALMAYHANADFIYKEQDCLAFGPWVEQIYMDAQQQNVDMLFGEYPPLVIEQSLFFVRYNRIIDFVAAYLSMPESDAELLPESKFARIKETLQGVGMLSFGYGRNRPIDFNASPFYAQHLTQTEMTELKARGLI